MIKVSRQRNKRSDHPSQKRFGLSAFGKDIELLVEPNNDIIDTDQGLAVERRTVGGTLEKEIHFPKGRFYVGQIASDPNAHVAVREIDEEKGHLVREISSVTITTIATNSTPLVAELNAFSITLYAYSKTIISLKHFLKSLSDLSPRQSSVESFCLYHYGPWFWFCSFLGLACDFLRISPKIYESLQLSIFL